MQGGLAALLVEIGRLLLEQSVDVRIAAVDVRAAGGDEGLQPGGRVAEGAAGGLHDVLELLVGVRAEEGRALERPQRGADADGLQVVQDRLGQVRVGRVAEVLARVEAARVAGLGEQPLGTGRIIGDRRRLPEKLEDVGDDAVGDSREAERLGLVDRVAIEGHARRLPHLGVVPGRLRVPLLGEVEPERSLQHGGLELQARRATHLLCQRPADRVDDVRLAALERGQPRRLVGNDPEHQAPDAGALAPVLVERLQHQLHARRERDELVGAGADRRLLEAVVTDPLHVLLGHDPAGAGGRRVEGQEVGPRLLQPEAHPAGIDDLDGGHPLLERLVGRAAIALEGELHVLAGHRLAVVEAHALAQHELVGEVVLRHRPRFGQARGQQLARHRLGQRVVDGVVDHVRRDDPLRLGGVEPGGRQRDVHAPGELVPLGSGLRRRQQRRGGEQHEHGQARRSTHDRPPRRAGRLELRPNGGTAGAPVRAG